MQDPDTRPRIDGSLARDEDGGRRRQGDEQDRIEGSTAHDPADGDDSFSFESLIFPVLLRKQLSTEPPSFNGAMDAPKALQSVMINCKDNYGRNCNPHFWFRRGYFCGSASMCEWIFAGVSPPGALSAPKGEWPYTEAPTMWSCPD